MQDKAAKSLIVERHTRGSFLRPLACVLLAYAVAVLIGIEGINSTESGGILQNWHAGQQEMYGSGGGGSGEGKMRGNGDFQGILAIFGVPAYPASAIAAWIFGAQAVGTPRRRRKLVYAVLAFTSGLILIRLMQLGVFSAGAGIG